MIATIRSTNPATLVNAPANRPRAAAAGPAPTIVRTTRDSSLFRGWGVKI